MKNYLEKILDLAGTALTLSPPAPIPPIFDISSAVIKDLLEMLKKKNGMYLFERALHIFPAQTIENETGLIDWNIPELWIDNYKGLACKCFFFAEDVFGGQFCIRRDGIYSFDPETADFQFLATDIETWSEIVLKDHEVLTGSSLAHEWRKLKGILPSGKRLLPSTPFVLGGAFAVDNLEAFDSLKSMQLRANLAIQIKNLPDGTKIKWKIEE